MNIVDFTETELAIAKGRVFAIYVGNYELYQTENPIGSLLGGQPAAGKSKLPDRIRNQYKDVKFVFINGDEYRQYHPRAQEIDEEYGQDAPKYTQPFSNLLVEYLKAECLRLRCNFIIEGTMRTYSAIERTAREVKQAGFRCEAHALAVHRQDSLLGVFQRFESDKQRTGVGRFSPIEVHDEAYRQIPINLDKAHTDGLFGRIVIYTRQLDGQLAIGLDLSGGQAESVDFVTEFNRLRQPIFQKSFYHDQWVALNELAQTRGETNETYRQQISDFISQYSH